MSGTGSPQEDGEGLAGMGVSPGRHSGAERVVGYRPLELGEQARHTEALAGALRENWLAGEQLNMERPVGERIDWLQWAHAIEQRLLAGLNDREPSLAAPFAPVTAPVDTGHDQAIRRLVGRWLQRTQNDDPRLAAKLMNDVAAVVRGMG